MEDMQAAFQIECIDNVATALTGLSPGAVWVLGDAPEAVITAVTEVSVGHKIALCDIAEGEDIVKYGVRIGRATAAIPAGSWVHLQVMCSVYDERSSHLDVNTGAPNDTRYE